MFKVYSVCVATVLLLSVGAFASGGSVGQIEQFNIIGNNAAILSGGPGSAISGNMATVCQGQTVSECCGIAAMQNENAMLSQSADAVGKCGLLSVVQGATAGGAQEQLATLCSSKAQGQALNLALIQTATKTDGDGSAGGAQGTVTDQNQSILGGGIMTESQFVGATQYANVAGTCGADALAANSLGISATQAQMAN